MEGFKFLKKKYELHNTEEVQSAAERTNKRTGEKVAQRPEAQIENYLDRFKEIIEREDETKKERGIEALKKLLHDKYIIKEVPDSYFRLQVEIAKERGEEYPQEITNEMYTEALELLQKDQEASLDYWIDYLSSEDAMYPDWAKYWAFRSMLNMSEYDKEKQSFGHRSKDTTAPFPDLNQEALATSIDYILNEARGEHIDNPIEEPENEFAYEEKSVSDKDFQKLLTTENFAKYYAFAIEHVVVDNAELYKITEGEWRKFDQGSNAEELVKSIQGKGTGWCTAGKATAETQVQRGDFYVYYSQNDLGDPKIPRLAIRMEEDSIGEVRGVAHKQEIDPYISDVLEEKMNDFGEEGEVYKKKSQDMKHLTSIDHKNKDGEVLTKEDLRFLYEMDGKIEGFGYGEDIRIKETLEGRDMKEDFSVALDVSKEKISFTQEEALSGYIKFHYGDLDLNSLETAEGLTLPESIDGDISLNRLTTAEGLILPKNIDGDLSFKSLATAEGLTLPESIGGSLNLEFLTTAEGLTLPENIGGSLHLENLTTAEGLTLPENIGGDISFFYLTTAEGLTLPENIGGDIYLGSLPVEDKKLLKEKYPQHADKIK